MQAPPKFSSFRPKPLLVAGAVTSEPKPDGRQLAGSRRHNHDGRHESHHGRRPHSKTGIEREETLLQEPTTTEVSDVEANNIFLVDRRGDPENERYGTNNKYSIPAYWPSRRRTLGERASSGTALGHKPRPLSSLTRQDRQLLAHDVKFVGPTFTDGEHGQNFLPLKAGSKRKRHDVLGEYRGPESINSRLENPLDRSSRTPSTRHSAIELGDERSGELAYVPGKDGHSSTAESSSDSESADDTDSQQLKNENARLASRIKVEPENVRAWEEYINYQSIWNQQGYSTVGKDDPVLRRNTAPIRLSMYERALSSVRRFDNARERLLIGMMTEGELLWENAKLNAKWLEIIKENKQFSDLWFEYLNFTQSNFANFKLERCRDQCVGFLQDGSEETISTADQCHAFLRLTKLLSDAGFGELGLAHWQAALELNCFNPPHLHDFAERLRAFEDFWDTEVPRIGETDAHGWSNGSKTIADTVKDLSSINKTKGNLLEGSGGEWLSCEMKHIRESVLPGRTTDDTAGDDPYHVIIFSDIQPALFKILPEQDSKTLIDAFLYFLHLPPLIRNSDLFGLSTFRDSFVSNEISAIALPEHERAINGSLSTSYQNFDHLVQDHPTTLSTMFCNGSSRMQIAVECLDMEKRHFVSRTLRALVDKYNTWDELAEYLVAFEMHAVSASAAKKLARSLLKSRSSNLPLYAAYGLIEARLGNNNASDKVFSTAITLSASFTPEARTDVVHLWRAWIWETLSTGDTTTALLRLLNIGKHRSTEHTDEMNPRLADVYATEAQLIVNITTALTRARDHDVASYVELLAILHYLTPEPNSPSISSAISSYATSLVRLATAPSLTLELVHQSRAHVLSLHIHASRPYRPKDIRSCLTESIVLFPSNTIFLSLYRENEKRNRADDRVRGIVEDLLHKPLMHSSPSENQNKDNVVTHAFAITTEIQRGIVAGSTAHSVRAAFVRATNSRACRNSATLWTAWISYECSLLPEPWASNRYKSSSAEDEKAKQQKSRIRDVFFQGLRNLPWHKKYAMLAWRLRKLGCVDDRECRIVYEGMVERGLRLFCEMEEDE